MNTYIVTEKQNINSIREGVEISARNYTAAKIIASKMQCFIGTVVVISDASGNDLFYKKDGEWFDA
jgi:predicted hotdog family 3-hydroxylacyl-ACP dehydratase